MRPRASLTRQESPGNAIEAVGKKRRGRKKKEETKTSDEPASEEQLVGTSTRMERLLLRKQTAQTAEPRQKRRRKRFTENEMKEMWLFVVEKIRDRATAKIIRPKIVWSTLWEEFIPFARSTRDKASLNVCFQRLKKGLHKSTFDLQTRTNLYYALQMPIEDNEFLEEIRSVAEVVLDKSNRIIAYRKKRRTGSLLSLDEDYWDEVWDEEEISRRQNEEQQDDGEEVEEDGDETDEMLDGSP